MKQKIYVIRDKLSKRAVSMSFYQGDEEFIRRGLSTALYDYFLRDIDCYCIGEFDDVKLTTKMYVRNRSVDVRSYLFPKTPVSDKGDDLPLEDVEKSFHDAKNEFRAQAALAKAPIKEVENE